MIVARGSVLLRLNTGLNGDWGVCDIMDGPKLMEAPLRDK